MSKRENPITVGWALAKMVFLAVWGLYGLLYAKGENGPKPDFLGKQYPKHLRAGFFCRLRLKTNNYVFLNNSTAIWALAYGQSAENDWMSRFEPILKKPDFWRFSRSRTAPNSGDIRFPVPNSCSAQFFTPVWQFWAQSMVKIKVFQAPQKCYFRLSR